MIDVPNAVNEKMLEVFVSASDLCRWITGLALTASLLAAADPTSACAGSRDLRLVNGKIVTMDARNSILHSVTIQSGRFDFSGGKARAPAPRPSICTAARRCPA